MGDILNFRKNITTEAKFANIHDYVFLFIPRGLHKTLIHRPSRIFENRDFDRTFFDGWNPYYSTPRMWQSKSGARRYYLLIY